MKQFNLERALAGDAVITRDGRKVTQLVKFDVDYNYNYKLYGVVSKTLCSWTIEGAHDMYSKEELKYDLFMKSKTVKVEGWINVYTCSLLSRLYETKEEAQESSIIRPHKTIFISEEIEVE